MVDSHQWKRKYYMHIYIDGDGCPVVGLALDIALAYDIEVTIVTDYAHQFAQAPHVYVKYCDQGKDSVDFAILHAVKKEDLVITQDYGLAGLLLAKQVHVISQNGLRYTNENMDQLLNQRHMSAKMRKKDHHFGHMKKRTREDDDAFCETMETFLKEQEYEQR